MSLDELKRENGTLEQAETEVETEQEEQEETLDNELEDETEVEAVESDEEAETSDEEEEESEEEAESELESWQRTEEGGDRNISLGKHIKVRTKLKDKIHEKDDEISQLRSEIESLKSSGVIQQEVKPSTSKRPSRKDFENEYGELNEDAYDAAVDDWNLERLKAGQQDLSNKEAQERQQRKQQEVVETSVKGHYEAAEKLVSDGMVKADAYQETDKLIRQRLDKEAPGSGDIMADNLIHVINEVAGENSAKIWFKLGRSPKELDNIIESFRDQTTIPKGYAAIAKMSSEISSPKKKRSLAKKPAKQISGDKTATVNAKKMKRKVDEARKRGDIQTVISLKREAKKQGVDVKTL